MAARVAVLGGIQSRARRSRMRLPNVIAWPYRWYLCGDRKGEPCRIVDWAMESTGRPWRADLSAYQRITVEFRDGTRVQTTRLAVKRRALTPELEKGRGGK